MVSFVLLMALQAASPKLVAPAWTTVKVEPELAAFFADHFEQKLRANGVEVVSAKDIGTLLGFERQKQLLGCAENAESCMAELGSALGAEGSVLVSVARVGVSLHANIKLLSTGTGKVLAETSARGSGDESLLGELTAAADRIALTLGLEGPQLRSARERRRVAWIPALGAAVFLAGGATCFGLAGGQLDALDKELASAHAVTPTAERAASTGKTLELLGWIGAGVGVAAGVTALVLFLTGEGPAMTPSVSLSANGQVSFGITGWLP